MRRIEGNRDIVGKGCRSYHCGVSRAIQMQKNAKNKNVMLI